jgi:hypothetical protein
VSVQRSAVISARVVAALVYRDLDLSHAQTPPLRRNRTSTAASIRRAFHLSFRCSLADTATAKETTQTQLLAPNFDRNAVDLIGWRMDGICRPADHQREGRTHRECFHAGRPHVPVASARRRERRGLADSRAQRGPIGTTRVEMTAGRERSRSWSLGRREEEEIKKERKKCRWLQMDPTLGV